jgi:hypothetical protein
MAITLNPGDISSFTLRGNQPPTAGGTLIFDDEDPANISGLVATDPDAATGIELDLEATFQVSPIGPWGVDVGFQVAINDGPSNRCAIAACIVIQGVPHIALVGQGQRNLLTTYPAFIVAEWQASPLSIKLRRTAEGGAQLLEINGAPPSARVELLASQVATPGSGGGSSGTTAELGCFSAPAIVAAEVQSFSTRRAAQPVQGALSFTRFRIRDAESGDALNFRADFQLGSDSNSIDPSTEPVTVRLSTTAGTFYSQTLDGFSVRGEAPRRRWTLNDAERARAGIETLIIEENPNNSGSIFLRDRSHDCGAGDFSAITAEIVIGGTAIAG